MITAGEVLKRKREALGKDLDVVSVDTKIQRRFLEYIEQDQYEKFDSDIFASGFIKIYSQYLGLDVEKLLALYRRSRPQSIIQNKESKTVIKNKKSKISLNITPKAVAITSIALFLVGITTYIGYQIYKFQKPPELNIVQPQDEQQTDQEDILIQGSTESNTIVEINKNPVQVDSTGWFEYTLQLTEGINTINIKAKKENNTSLETTKSLRVTYNKPTENTVEEDIQPQVYILKLKIGTSSAWVKLDIDEENKLAQVLEPNTEKEYEVKSTFSITTGRLDSTNVTVNDQPITFPPQQTGVAQTTCNITIDNIVCE